MKHLCVLDQFSVDFRHSLQENLYMPLHIFAMPTPTQGMQMLFLQYSELACGLTSYKVRAENKLTRQQQ